MDELTWAPSSRQLHTIAIDPDSVGFDEIDRADLDSYPTASASIHNQFPGYASDYERRSFEFAQDDDPIRSLLLRGEDPKGDPGDKIYMSLFGHLLRSDTTIVDEAYYTSFGGVLNNIGERAMSVLPYDWSRPAHDAFGFPTDWVPPADASLIGGAPGEPSYQYYLRSAKEAAQEATTAVQKAIDNLVEETLVRSDLEAAEQRASTISEIEMRALCGTSEGCDVERALWRPEVGPCEDMSGPLPPEADALCEVARGQIEDVLGPVVVANEVLGVPAGVAPTFTEFQGSEMQRVLVRQWNGLHLLQQAVNNTMDVAVGVGLDNAAASDALIAAGDELEQADFEVDLAFSELDAQQSEIAALFLELEASTAEYEARIEGARAARNLECNHPKYLEAVDACRGYADCTPPGSAFEIISDEGAFHCFACSSATVYDTISRCEHAQIQYVAAASAVKPARVAIDAHRKALMDQTGLDGQTRQVLLARQRAAYSNYQATVSAFRAATNSFWSQFTALLTQLQQMQGELIAAAAELEQLQLRAESAVASANLERDLAEKQADERFGLQRKFRSYDMWRARALLEGARRLSVAARRAIEARFVVDLSELQAPQAFVEAPAIWADEVYGTDLDAPAVVGLSVAPQIGNTIYPNQLLDYVGNLERFVQGYTVTYPTSVASPDTEVVTLPGPELTEEVIQAIEDEEEIVEVLSGRSLGWTFYCPSSGAWRSHPGVGQVPLEHRVETMCDGDLPPRMRYSFGLDAWARLNRSINVTPLTQRHNVLWRRLAVNLVGTGIRDCRRGGDPQVCFSEPFLRFQLVHSGPAWAMNHAQQWRAFNLPGAFIESGKALASEEWLDPIANSWNVPYVANISRGEFFGRPVNGGYELIVELSPDVRPERIEQVQLLVETDYWVRQQ